MDLLHHQNIEVLLIYFVITVILSGFFSGVEASYLSLNRVSANRLERSKSWLTPIIRRYLEQIDMFIASLLLANLFINILATLLAKRLVQKIGAWWFPSFQIETPLASILFICLFAFIFIIICEISPKRLSIKYAEIVAFGAAIPMLPVYYLTYPLTWTLARFSSRFIHIFTDASNEHQNKFLGKEEFLGYIKLSSDMGVLQKIETTMLENLVINKNIPVKSLLIPRQVMKGFNLQVLPTKILSAIQRFPYKTIPVYDGLKDNIVGVISKRKLALFEEGENIDVHNFTRHLTKPKLIPEGKSIIEVVADMHESDSEVAIITDEHGGIEGIVTYKDIVERLLGRSHNNTESLSLRKISPNNYLVNPHTSLEVINKTFHTQFLCKKAQTIGGYLLEQIGDIPKSGTVYTEDGFEFHVREATQKSITKLSIKKRI